MLICFRHRTRVVPLFLLLASPSAMAAVTISASIETNLHYTLDCQAELIPCTRQALVVDEWHTSGDIEQTLNYWRDARQRNTRSTTQQPIAAEPLPMPNFFSALPDAGSQLADSADLPFLTDHLTSEFEQRWSGEAQPHLRRIATQLRWELRQPPIQMALSAAAQFFGATADDLPQVVLVAIRDARFGSRAQLRGDTMYVETALGESVYDRLPVVAHESVHYWAGRMRAQQASKLASVFHESDSHCASIAFGLFDEAIASAIGNGYFERLIRSDQAFDAYLKLPESFYADPIIDLAAKALLPLVSEYLDDGRALDVTFIEQYIQLTARTLANHCNSLALQLRTSGYWLANTDMLEASQVSTRALGSATVLTDVATTGTSAALVAFQGLSGIIMTPSGDVRRLPAFDADMLDALTESLKENDTFVLGWSRNAHASLYVVVAPDSIRASQLLIQMVALKRQRFSGVWLPPPLPGSRTSD
ncbi:MAG: hypothetical protein AAGA84_01190 [Pseudomonadota bacterium]